MSEPTTLTSRPVSSQTPRLSWPPPGLENLQGSLWFVVGEFVIGSAILAFPLLIAIATQQRFSSLGAFGMSWWIPLATTLIGLVILAGATWRLSALLRKAAGALSLGHGIGTIAIVMSDIHRDAGFLLQGARGYAAMSAAERRSLVAVRLTSAACYLCASLWIPPGLTLSILLAASGTIESAGVWTLTLMPAAVMVLAGGIGRLGEQLTLRRVKRRGTTDVEGDVRRETDEWNANLALAADDVAIGSTNHVRAGFLKFAAFAVVLPALLLLGPLSAVLTSAAMGPVMATIALPRYGVAQQRMAVAEVMRSYRPAANPAITPTAGGQALYNLSHTGRAPENARLTRPPAVRHPAWPDGPDNIDAELRSRASQLFDLVAKGQLTTAQRDYLALTATHPAHAEFNTVGYARSADFAGARFILPLPDTLSAANIPIPRFGPIREAANMHIAKAAYELTQGRPAEAERLIRETIGVGFLLIDDGTTFIESLIGAVIVGIGADGLEQFYLATGRTNDAALVKDRRETAERTATIATSYAAESNLQGTMGVMPEIVRNPESLRGLRWELLSTFSTFAPCINLRNAVFGLGADYDAWLAEARSTMVRYPAEAELFAVTQAGYFGSKSSPVKNCRPRWKVIQTLKSL